MPILEVRDRNQPYPKPCGRLVRRGTIGERHNTIGVAIRKRPQKHRIHNAENSRISAHAERHNQNGKRGKTWIPAHRAAGISEIAHQVINVIHSSHVAAFLLALLDSINRAKGDGTGFFRGKAFSNLELDTLFNVELKLFFELPFDAIPLE